MNLSNQRKNVPQFSILALLMALGFSQNALAGQVNQLKFMSEAGLTRLQIESELGTLDQIGLSEDGKTLALELKGVRPEALQRFVTDIKSQSKLVQSVEVTPHGTGGSLLVVKFVEGADVLDETLVNIGAGKSSWELVLARQARTLELAEFDVKLIEGKLGVFLRGGAEMDVQPAYQAQGQELSFNFPKIPQARMQELTRQINNSTSHVKSVTVTGDGKQGSRVTLQLDKPIVMGRPVAQKTGQTTALSLVSSFQPDLVADGFKGIEVESLGVEMRQGVPAIVVSGSAGVGVEATRASDGKSMTLDLTGVSRKRAAELVAGFRSSHPSVIGVRLIKGDERSSQLAVDFIRPIAITPGVMIDDTSPTRKKYLVALAQPMATAAAQAPLPTTLKGDVMVGRTQEQPAAMAKPLSLGAKPGDINYRNASVAAAEKISHLGMMDALERALKNDPKYQAAKKEFEAASEAIPQARAGYLPTATFDFQRNQVTQNVTNTAGPQPERNYPLRTNGLTITQPIIKAPAFFKMQQAEVAVEQARMALVASEQDLMVRVAGAYLNMLATRDGLDLAKAEREATEKQFQLAKARVSSGLATQTQLFETEGRYSLTLAKEIEAANSLEDARLALKEIIGADVDNLKAKVGDFQAVPPQPAQPEPWVNAALQQNLSLQVKTIATEISQLEIKRQQAGYAPTLNLVASANANRQGDSFVAGSPVGAFNSRSNSVGVQFNMPLFEGGMTTSLVREASARHEKALQEMDLEHRKTERLAKTSLLSLVASAQSTMALRKSLMAQESALETKLEGMRSGLFSVVQVVDAYRLMYAAKRDFYQSRYDYLLNRVKLKQAIGSLSRSDIAELADMVK